ncbi:cyclin-dependent kinase inhibitor 3 isoform X1 [Pygocentrus nattereri]|uniref:Cyclin-dependent kinase inhibitor 3 n=1 Tax=Pygocentrus nattereri TaxID=42514 RepID=A0A3B4CVT3_PYGNA|nr:cyclin-dependent kinase inhibitor 3 isoform X1 [Pygocentrus nattereri]XP_017537914.1 cyclin-dependent kinase inhibitor 3 isoform X1 [Pygocentrus nattereri]
MKISEFDSSDEEEEAGDEEHTPLQISWLSLSVVECSQFLGICSLPGCRYKDIRRNLEKDVGDLCAEGVEDVFVFCTRAELVRYRVPCLLERYTERGLVVHHLPFPDGGAPEMPQCCHILEELQLSLQNQRRTVIHCYGGLGRSGLIAACLLLHLSVSMTPSKAIDILRELRGSGAIQTVKQYNFLHEFREKLAAYQETKGTVSERSVSR